MKAAIASVRLLFLITDEGTDKKIDRLFSAIHLPVYCQFRRHGTATPEFLNIR